MALPQKPEICRHNYLHVQLYQKKPSSNISDSFIFSVGNNYFIDVQNEYYKYIIILLLATINNWLKVEYSVNLLPRSDISVISSEASFEVILAGEKTLTPCCPPWIVCLHDIYIQGLPAPPVTGASNWGGTWQTWQLGISWTFLSMKYYS